MLSNVCFYIMLVYLMSQSVHVEFRVHGVTVGYSTLLFPYNKWSCLKAKHHSIAVSFNLSMAVETVHQLLLDWDVSLRTTVYFY